MKKNMPLARRIYWNLSLVALMLAWGGQYRRHRNHEKHYTMCACMSQCFFCALDGLRDKKSEEPDDWRRKPGQAGHPHP